MIGGRTLLLSYCGCRHGRRGDGVEARLDGPSNCDPIYPLFLIHSILVFLFWLVYVLNCLPYLSSFMPSECCFWCRLGVCHKWLATEGRGGDWHVWPQHHNNRADSTSPKGTETKYEGPLVDVSILIGDA
jgi:hypothetical protein